MTRRFSVAAVALLIGFILFGSLTSARSQEADVSAISAQELLDMAHIAAPPEGVTLQLHVDWPAEHPFDLSGVLVNALTANISSAGDLSIVSVVPQAATAEDNGPEEEGECTDQFFKPTGPKWSAENMPVLWRFRKNSMPDNLEPVRTIYALRRAHMAWPRLFTNCNDTNANAFEFIFAGPSAAKRTVKYDHVNLVDFGPLEGGALAMNYTWFTGTKIVEVDLRFNRNDYKWTTNEKAKWGYQVRNVATHELGHQLGLDDLTDPHGALTMFGRIPKGEITKTTLGRGDMRGASLLSP